MEEYQRVYITQDEDGHDYVIPYDKKEEFGRLCEVSYESEEFDEFEEKFGEYMTGGDINELEIYIKK